MGSIDVVSCTVRKRHHSTSSASQPCPSSSQYSVLSPCNCQWNSSSLYSFSFDVSNRSTTLYVHNMYTGLALTYEWGSHCRHDHTWSRRESSELIMHYDWRSYTCTACRRMDSATSPLAKIHFKHWTFTVSQHTSRCECIENTSQETKYTLLGGLTGWVSVYSASPRSQLADLCLHSAVCITRSRIHRHMSITKSRSMYSCPL